MFVHVVLFHGCSRFSLFNSQHQAMFSFVLSCVSLPLEPRVVQELSKTQFERASVVTDELIRPMEIAVNTLLRRTKVLHDLSYLGRGHPKQHALQDESKRRFLEIVSGNFGDKIIDQYCQFLQSGLAEAVQFGLEVQPAELNRIHSMTVLAITDVFRRFKHEFACPPWSLFNQLGMTPTDFAQAWGELEARWKACSACVDAQFSAVLLTHFQGLESQPLQIQASACKQLQTILSDIAVWTPVTSDSVELKNGQVQWDVSRRSRQHTKHARSASETTLLNSVAKQYAWVREVVGVETLPAKTVSAGILKMIGTKSSNQNSRKDSWFCMVLLCLLSYFTFRYFCLCWASHKITFCQPPECQTKHYFCCKPS